VIMTRSNTFDYLVIGGGSAGAIVAARLAEDSEITICLIEAGPTDEDKPEILELQRWPGLLHTDYDYGYKVEPQERGNDNVVHSRGRMLGGSGSHNICQAWRSPDHDMHAWEAAGASDWGPAGAREYFDRVLERTGLSYAGKDNDAAQAFIQAGKQAGYPEREMAADAETEGIGWVALNARDGIRQSSSVAYLRPESGTPANLTIFTDTTAMRLLFDDAGRATGVETTAGSLYATREVILSCGAFDTPKLMMLSGIGPADHLRAHGIEVRADLPVGEHLLDHPEGGVVYETTRAIHQPNTVFCDAVLLTGVPGGGTDWPELMLWFFSGDFESFTTGVDGDTGITPEGVTAFTIAADVLHSKAEGRVRLRSSDPADPPVIDPRYFTDADGWDEQIMLEGLKIARKVAEQPALSDWIAREVAPGPDVQSDEELLEYIHRTSYTAYHPSGTCRMGASDDPGAVVDPELRVRGIPGLRLADASIMPTLPGCNPNITCMMIGEKAADLIRGKRW
jgi:choline oxidase